VGVQARKNVMFLTVRIFAFCYCGNFACLNVEILVLTATLAFVAPSNVH
jgi:hypothetical protein